VTWKVILNHELRFFETGYPVANGLRRFAKVLPGIINGLEASSDFLPVKQLAIVNFWSRADRFAFFLPLATRFEVVTTSSTLPRPLLPYSVFLDITIEYKLQY